MNKDLKDKTLEELEQIVVEMGQKKYLAEYIFSFIHTKGTTEISQITPLSKDFRGQLAQQGCYISGLSIQKKLGDKDGTIKYVFSLADGSRIETVLLRDDRRRTLCVSTQVGCALGCTFCATAKLGFQRNLTAVEIVDQVNIVVRDASCVARANYAVRNTHDAGRINNVVYMGMGEPLLNYNSVLKSVRILNNPSGKNIGIRHITISTCGIVPGIKKLANEDIAPRLAVSLNAPTDTLRTQLMPINVKYPITELLKAVRIYQNKTGQRVTFEYVLIKGLNDSVEQARMLIKLLSGLVRNVNLIEHNPHPGCGFVGSDSRGIKQFASVLERGGIETTVRYRKGRGIKAACGQLGADCLRY